MDKTYEGILGQNHHRFQAVFDAIPDCMLIIDPNNTIVALNRAAAKLLQKPFTELVGRKCYQQLEARPSPCPDCPGLEALRNDRHVLVERTLKEHTGKRVDLEIRGVPLSGSSGRIGYALVYRRDVTERKALERAQTELEKLSVVERVASGVAHDLKNQSAIVSSSVQFLRKKLRAEKGMSQYVEVIERTLNRMALTISRLLDSTRVREVHLAPTNLTAVLERACSLMSGEFQRHGTRVKKHLRERLPLASADESQMEHVFLNLLLNAVQAMPKRGYLTISSRRTPNDHSVSVEIADTGSGIVPQNLERVFDPFFTTREEGSGLGLWMCKRSIEAQNGTIQIANRPRKGAKVVVTLPMYRQTRS